MRFLAKKELFDVPVVGLSFADAEALAAQTAAGPVEVRVFTERLAGPPPPRIAHDIDVRREGPVETGGAHLARRDTRDALGERHVERRREGEVFVGMGS